MKLQELLYNHEYTPASDIIELGRWFLWVRSLSRPTVATKTKAHWHAYALNFRVYQYVRILMIFVP